MRTKLVFEDNERPLLQQPVSSSSQKDDTELLETVGFLMQTLRIEDQNVYELFRLFRHKLSKSIILPKNILVYLLACYSIVLQKKLYLGESDPKIIYELTSPLVNIPFTFYDIGRARNKILRVIPIDFGEEKDPRMMVSAWAEKLKLSIDMSIFDKLPTSIIYRREAKTIAAATVYLLSLKDSGILVKLQKLSGLSSRTIRSLSHSLREIYYT